MISYSDMYQIDLANRRVLLSGTYQLYVPLVFVLNVGQLFFQDNLKCTKPDSIPSHVEMSAFRPTFHKKTCRSKWPKVESLYHDLPYTAEKKTDSFKG